MLWLFSAQSQLVMLSWVLSCTHLRASVLISNLPVGMAVNQSYNVSSSSRYLATGRPHATCDVTLLSDCDCELLLYWLFYKQGQTNLNSCLVCPAKTVNGPSLCTYNSINLTSNNSCIKHIKFMLIT